MFNVNAQFNSNALLHRRPSPTQMPIDNYQHSVVNGYVLLPAESINKRGVRYLNTEDINDMFSNSQNNFDHMNYVCRNVINPGYIKDVMEDRDNVTMAHISPVQIRAPLPDDWSNVLVDKRADVDMMYNKRGAFVSSIAVFQHVPEDMTVMGGIIPEHFYTHLICNSEANTQGENWEESMHGVHQGGKILSELVESTALLNGVNVMLTPASQHAANVWHRNGYIPVQGTGQMIKKLVN